MAGQRPNWLGGLSCYCWQHQVSDWLETADSMCSASEQPMLMQAVHLNLCSINTTNFCGAACGHINNVQSYELASKQK